MLSYMPKVIFTVARNTGKVSGDCFWIHNLPVEKFTPLVETVCGHCCSVRHSPDWELARLQHRAEAAGFKACGVKPWIWNVSCLLIRLFTCATHPYTVLPCSDASSSAFWPNTVFPLLTEKEISLLICRYDTDTLLCLNVGQWDREGFKHMNTHWGEWHG